MEIHSEEFGQLTILILCRHGESQWNVERRVQGQSLVAPGLTAHGRWQAQRLAERLRQMDIDALYSSDLRRALETAQIVGAALGLEPVEDSRWRERDMGRWQGLTRSEIAARWPEEIAALQRGEDIRRGGGETYVELQARTLAALKDLLLRHPGQKVAVICHGGNIRACLLANRLDQAEGGDGLRWAPIPNASVTILQAHADQLRAVVIADASHLDGVEKAVVG